MSSDWRSHLSRARAALETARGNLLLATDPDESAEQATLDAARLLADASDALRRSAEGMREERLGG